jgi:hypothetical protein
MREAKFVISPIVLARYLFIITAAILILLSAGTFLRLGKASEMMVVYLVYGILMAGDAAAMFACGLWINRRDPKIYWFAVSVLTANIVLTIFDQFGLIDFLFVVLNGITVSILLAFRKEFI